VLPHQTSLDPAIAVTTEQLWLQTSEGPCLKRNASGVCTQSTPGKTILIALPLSVGDASPADANPVPKPVVCG
jgi:hypothetical protein